MVRNICAKLFFAEAFTYGEQSLPAYKAGFAEADENARAENVAEVSCFRMR